jgi:hypothetical protein
MYLYKKKKGIYLKNAFFANFMKNVSQNSDTLIKNKRMSEKFWANRIRYYTSLRVASRREVHGGGLTLSSRFLTQVDGFCSCSRTCAKASNKLDLFIQPLKTLPRL